VGTNGVPTLLGLEHATNAKDMNAPGWRLHRLSGDFAGFYSIMVSGNWRLIFRFEGKEALDVDYVDYH
jgi:toxin HigB-1